MLAAVIVVAAQLITIAALGTTTPQNAGPTIHTGWFSTAWGCASDPNATAVLNYTVSYDNFMGPSGYAVMAMGFGGHMRRYWAIYVPAGAWQLQEKGSVLLACDEVSTFRVLLVSTIAS